MSVLIEGTPGAQAAQATRRQPGFVAGLASFGERPALVEGERLLSYSELDAAVEDAAARLDGPRRLVAVLASRGIDDLVQYLGALRAGLPVVLVPRCRPDAVLARYAPEVVVEQGQVVRDERPVLDRRLHDDLAVLLSTSGSTGSPRLVRLSHDNLESNAEAIVASLGLRPDDRAVTTLEPSYSYGLSVLHSHLAAGASLLLTDRSVTDDAFERLVRDGGATTLAAVPYTFDLLDRHGADVLEAPTLRQVTCAGGRLPAQTARRYAALGRRHGFELVVMYGATEATARMAVLPPDLLEQYAETVGRPIPGGSFRLHDVDEDGVGELIYSGPNVMLGYAESSADLVRGRDVDELPTGDRARFTADGLVEVVGRRAQIAKVHGLRLDLADLDRAFEDAGIEAACVPLDDAVGVAVVGVPERVACAVVSGATGLPPASVRVAVLDVLPRLPNGKLDRPAVAAAATRRGEGCGAAAAVGVEALRRRFEALIGVPVLADQSFADVGGDSLAYVAVSVAVEDALGHLPRGWHRTSVEQLAARAQRGPAACLEGPAAPERPRLLREVETSVVLRALAILAVVASHVGLIDVRGGAHLLLAIVGFNLARFHIATADPALRLRRMLRTTAEILVPALLLMAVLVAGPTYSWYLLGATSWVVPTSEAPEWRYWFIEALLWLLPLLALGLRLPWVESARRRAPWLLPAALTVAAWAAFHLWVPDARPAVLFAPLAVAWVALLGWTVAEATTPRLRIATTVLVIVTVLPSYDGSRMWVIPAGILALLWLPSLRVPAAALPAVRAIAEASLYIYLTHWVVLEVLDYGWSALLVSLAVGIATYRGVTAARARLRRSRRPALARAVPVSA